MPATGAYCYSLLNNYNGTRRPPVVFGRDGDARLAVRREEYERPARPGRALTMTPHPLDPLGADEIRAAAAILRRDQGVGERWRFASIELREPSKATVRDASRPGDPIAREAVVICWNRDDGRVYKARVALGEDRVVAWEHQPDGQPNMTVDEFHECDAALRRDPRVIEALAKRGITDMDLVLIDTWAYGAHLVPEAHRGGRIGWADVWYRSRDGLEPVRQPGHRPALRRRPQPRWSCSRSRTSTASTSRDTMGEYVPHLVPGLRLREDVKPLEITQPEGASFTLDGNRAALAEVVAARRLQPPRGHGPAHRRLRRRRPHAPGRAPAVVRRDGRALPRPDDRPLPAHRVRHRRVGPRLHDHVARARLRLPRRDRLPRRGDARHARRAVHDPQRDLHPRGGRRRPVEARRRRRPAPRCAARAGSCSRSTSRSPTTSTSSTGASTRTATSSARCGRPGSWSPRTSPRASSRRTARSSTSARTRRSTSTSSSPGWTSTSTARPTPSTPRSPRRSRSARTTRTASRSCSATRRCAPSPRAGRTTTGARSAPGRSSTSTSPTGSGRRSATSSSRAAASRR